MRFSTSARKIVQEFYNNLVCVWKLFFPVALCNQWTKNFAHSDLLLSDPEHYGSNWSHVLTSQRGNGNDA